ncbi:hypothetical protein ACQX2H_04760 [Corynebacterium diphtheriae]
MFKRSLASLAAVAVVSGVVVAPANAMTLTVNDNDTCTINLNDEEADILKLSARTISKAQIPTLKMYTNGLSALRAKRADLEKRLTDSKLNAVDKEKLKSELEETKKRITVVENFAEALEACIAGNNYNSKQPEGPGKQPEGPSDPGPSKPEANALCLRPTEQ